MRAELLLKRSHGDGIRHKPKLAGSDAVFFMFNEPAA